MAPCAVRFLVGMARCAVPVAERSVRRRNWNRAKPQVFKTPFRPVGRRRRSAASLPSRLRRPYHNLICPDDKFRAIFPAWICRAEKPCLMKSRCGLIRARKFILSRSIAGCVANMVGTAVRVLVGTARCAVRVLVGMARCAVRTSQRDVPARGTSLRCRMFPCGCWTPSGIGRRKVCGGRTFFS